MGIFQCRVSFQGCMMVYFCTPNNQPLQESSSFHPDLVLGQPIVVPADQAVWWMLIIHLSKISPQKKRCEVSMWYCWWTKSCTSWYGKYPIYLQGFTRPRWCRISSINSMSIFEWDVFQTKLQKKTRNWLTKYFTLRHFVTAFCYAMSIVLLCLATVFFFPRWRTCVLLC